MGRKAMSERIQLSRSKGWRMPPHTTKVDRSTVYGNPFPISGKGDCWRLQIENVEWCFTNKRDAAAAAVSAFESWLYGFGEYRALFPARRAAMVWALQAEVGRNMACWCKLDMPCHADVMLRYVRDLSSFRNNHSISPLQDIP